MRFEAVRRLLEKLQTSGKKTLELEETAGNFTDSEMASVTLSAP